VLYTATRSRLRPRAGCAPDGRVRGSCAAGGGARLPDRPQHSHSRSASPASPAPSETTSPPSLVRDDSPRHIVDHSGGSDHAARAPEHGRPDCDLTEGGGTRANGSHERAHIARERSMITVPHMHRSSSVRIRAERRPGARPEGDREFCSCSRRTTGSAPPSGGVGAAVMSARRPCLFNRGAGFLPSSLASRRGAPLAVGDRRVGQEQRLEFCGRDLVALVLDQLLDPVDDPQRPVLLDAGDVPGVSQPSGSIVSAVACGLLR
jgi:hypothetical protein